MDHLTGKTEEFARLYESAVDSSVVRAFGQTSSKLNQVFSIIEPYACELNRMVSPGSMTITAWAPNESLELVKEDWPHRPPQAVRYYRCRFATGLYSANIRGFQNKIEFFILPVEQAIRLNEAEEEFGCLMTFQCQDNRDGLSWIVEGKELSDNRLERYSLLFFNYLVDSTRQELLKGRTGML